MAAYVKLYDVNQNEQEQMMMVVSHVGVLYYANMRSGIIKWFYDTKKQIYQAFQEDGVVEYVDLAGEDKQPYHYSAGSREMIIGNTEDKLKDQIKGIFNKNPFSTYDKKVFYLRRDSGEEAEKDDNDIFTIERTEWNFSIDHRWAVRYSNMDVFFPFVDKKLDESKRPSCKVHCARTAETFIALCRRYNLHNLHEDGILSTTINLSKKINLLYPKQKAADAKNDIRYYKGTLDGLDVFVKRIPKKEKHLKVLDVYKTFNSVESVVKLLLVESDEHFHYLAFEKFEGNLTYSTQRLIEKQPEPFKLAVLRNVIRALIDLHANLRLHKNLAPENILIKKLVGGDAMIKFCGMGESECYQKETFKTQTYHSTERYRLGRTMLHLLTNGVHTFSESELPAGFEGRGSDERVDADLQEVSFEAADLIRKLMCPGSRISLKMVLNHVLFWSPYTRILLLKDMSDHIKKGMYRKIEDSASEVFDGDWTLDDPVFKKWFAEMLKVPDEHKKVREVSEDHDEAETYVYDTKKLADLLRLIRNTINHPRPFYPACDKASLHYYITGKYPKLVTVAYNHMLANTSITHALYEEYCS